MRFVMLTMCVWLLAAGAFAQDAVPLPFAPSVPSVFIVEEVRSRTFEQDGRVQSRVGRVRSSLELQSREGVSYQVVWTTISADPAAIVIDNGRADPTLLIGRPITLILNEDGAPLTMADWTGVRRGMFRIMLEHERDQFWRQAYSATEDMMEGWSAEVAAPILMETLSILSACQNTHLTLQQEESAEVEVANGLNGPPVITRVTTELQAVDHAAGVAHIRHTRAPNIAAANASARASTGGLVRPKDAVGDTIEGASQSTSCEVDLRSGMVRSATFEVNMSLGGESETRRRVITVTAR